jgi:hypothetical protein
LIFGGISNQPFGVGEGNIGGGSSVTLKNNEIKIRVKINESRTDLCDLTKKIRSEILTIPRLRSKIGGSSVTLNKKC